MRKQNKKSEFEKKHLENICLILSLYKDNRSIKEIAAFVEMPDAIVVAIIENYIKGKYDQILINKHDTNNNQGRIK